MKNGNLNELHFPDLTPLNPPLLEMRGGREFEEGLAPLLDTPLLDIAYL